MRHRIWITLLAVACLVSPAAAQARPNMPEASLTRAQIVLTMARRDVFQKAMDLTGAQKDTFWNIYAEYDRQRTKLLDQTADLLSDYATNYDTLTNEQATKMMHEAATIQEKQVKLRLKYADEISRKLGGRVGARFFQIDDYLSTGGRLEILSRIPFVGDRPTSDTARQSPD
jgi:Spy/CpxP family protein refolding chaperone